MTLTTRLTLFFVATLAVVLIAFSITLYLLTQSQLYRELDARANAGRGMLSAGVEAEPIGLEWDYRAEYMRQFSDEALQWAAVDETGLIAGGTQAKALFPLRHEITNDDRSWDISLNNQPWRIIRKTILHPNPQRVIDTTNPVLKRYRQLTFLVAVPIAPVHETLQTLALRLAAITSATLLLATLFARWVCRRALLPLSRMAQATLAIRTDDLRDRLPVPIARDELHELGASFNLLLSRVQEAYERQKHFTGEASHQLRTPLTAMLGQMEISLRRNREVEDYKKTLHLVKDQATRLHEMVEMLLFLARADADARLPRLVLVDLTQWLRHYVNEAWSTHPRFADLKIQLPVNGVCQVSVHPELFDQAVGNLIDNAMKYSDPGTPIQLRLAQQGSEAVLSIEDRGTGIDLKEVPHLFSPFFRSDMARQRGVPGVGLGLAVSARIVHAFGGQIDFKNNVDQGGTFSISLPSGNDDQPTG